MRSGILLVPFALLALCCGGSSSETPWPVEPEGPALGPAGEGAPRGPLDEPEAPGQEAAPDEQGAPPGEPEAPPPADPQR
ncbi:MAG: hypothetical protein IT372_26485 [Polyangiaceae bacterium]|nr:hypothetical protein [Polyangiaceae bacterium]